MPVLNYNELQNRQLNSLSFDVNHKTIEKQSSQSSHRYHEVQKIYAQNQMNGSKQKLETLNGIKSPQQLLDAQQKIQNLKNIHYLKNQKQLNEINNNVKMQEKGKSMGKKTGKQPQVNNSMVYVNF